MKRIRAILILLLVVLLGACSQQATPNTSELNAQAGSWQKMGGALDFTAAKDAVNPKLLLDRQGNLVVAWTEYNNGPKVYMERWTSTGWQGLGKAFQLLAAYEYLGYSIVFDNSNSPVIASVVNSLGSINQEVAVYRFDTSSKTWKQLGSMFKGSPHLAADKNGSVYSVLYENLRFNFYESGPVDEGLGKGKNIIRRWNGSSWQEVRTYQAVVISSLRGYDVPVKELLFKSDGTSLVIRVNTDDFTTALKSWNGTTWETLCYTYRYNLANTVLDRQDQCFGSDSDLNIYQGSRVLSSKLNLDIGPSTFSQANRPIVVEDNDYDVIVKRWSGSSWVQVGGIIDRVASRQASFTDLIVDKNNTLYAAWSECVEYDAANSRCNNWNVYASKYVP